MTRGSKTDSILTILFLVLAAAAIICYFAVDDRHAFLYLGGAAVCFRLVQYLLRFIR